MTWHPFSRPESWERPRSYIIPADIFDWKPATGQQFDCIYFDIWPYICTDNLKEMTRLHRRFWRYLKGKKWMESWCRGQLQYQARKDRLF